MRRLSIVILITAAALATMPARASVSVVEVPVAFQIINQNTSVTRCQTDGRPYTVRGSLVGPEGVLDGAFKAVTLYQPGSGDASSWHFTAVPGHDHVTEMAKLGHVSVSLHNLGYGTSDAVDGMQVCFGAFADVIHQVIARLRSGAYDAGGGSGLAFERVALAGHSGGSWMAELEAVSFHDADAYVFSGWTDYAPALIPTIGGEEPAGFFFYSAAAGFAQRCATASESKQPGGPGGWAHVFTTIAEMKRLFPNAEAEVIEAFFPRYEQDPCGIGQDAGVSLAANIALAPTVTVPVLLAYGDREPFAGGMASVELQRARYAVNNDDVSMLVVPDSGHGIMIERPAPVFRAGLHDWLRARGF